MQASPSPAGPHVPAFYVQKSATAGNLGAHQPVVFETVKFNAMNVYNLHDGIFTAPVSGTYVFSWTIMTHGDALQYFNLVVDGQYYAHVHSAVTYSTNTNVVVMHLDAQNEVWIAAEPNSADTHPISTVHGGGYSTFSGWLLEQY
jgi:hypothetical protein